MQLASNNSQAKAHLPYDMSVATAFEAKLYLHALALMSREVKRKKPNVVQNAIKSTTAGVAVQFAMDALDTLTKSCLLLSLQVVV